MRELNDEYGERVELEITSIRTDEGRAAAAKYEFGGAQHGLVGFDSKGEVGFVMLGHNYPKDEIQENLDGLLR